MRPWKPPVCSPIYQLVFVTINSIVLLPRIIRWGSYHDIRVTPVFYGRHPTIVSQAGLDGIEPPFSRSELDFLPLEDSPIRLLVDLPRLELGTSPCKGGVLPLNYRPLAAADGIGPS